MKIPRLEVPESIRWLNDTDEPNPLPKNESQPKERAEQL
jgi:hypothetical protein